MTLFNGAPARRIASGFHPDPTICERPEGGYYMVNSSFEFFPGLPVFESEDGERWRKIGNALGRPSQFPYGSMGNSQGIYAPTLRYHDGTYYLIVTNVNRGNMILTSADPHAGWSDPIWIDGWPGIDPSLFFDDDGTAYICGNEGGVPDENGEVELAGIYLSKIDVASGTVLTARRRVCGGITGSNPEGPHLYRRGGLYYLMWAEGGTESGHMENIARAADPFGPYQMHPGNPLITNRSTHLTLQAIGHCDCAHVDGDRTLMVFHGTRNNDAYPAQGWLGREPYAVWFEWRDGWPALADQSYDCPLNGCGDSLEADVDWITPAIDQDGRFAVVPARHTGPEPYAGAADGAADDTVSRPSAPAGGGWPSSGPGVGETDVSPVPSAPSDPSPAAGTTITVRATEQDFSLTAGPPMIGTRQTDFRCTFAATLADPRALASGETGIAVYANADHYLELAASAADDVTASTASGDADAAGVDAAAVTGPTVPVVRIEARAHNAGLVSTVGSATLPADAPLRLVVRGDEQRYTFAVEAPAGPVAGDDAADGAAIRDLGSIPGKVLSFVNAGGFTGILLGVYAHGSGAVVFDDVRYDV